MKKITLLFLLISFKALPLCTLDVYLREHKSFDGKELNVTFAMGKELNEISNIDSYKEDSLYAYYVVDNEAIWFQITTPHDCGLEAYENCINKMPAMLEAVDTSGKEFRMVVYK